MRQTQNRENFPLYFPSFMVPQSSINKTGVDVIVSQTSFCIDHLNPAAPEEAHNTPKEKHSPMHFCTKAKVGMFNPSCPLKNNNNNPGSLEVHCASSCKVVKTNLPILHDSGISEHNILTPFSSPVVNILKYVKSSYFYEN